MLIKDWLDKFLFAHQLRHARDDWPAAGSSDGRRLWSVWFDAFKAGRITHREAEMASREINAAGLEWIDDHLPMLLGVIEQGRAKPTSIAKAPLPLPAVSAMSEGERRAEAERMLDAFYELGWELRWQGREGQFRCYPTRPDAPLPSMEFATRFRELRPEVRALLGHSEEPPLDMDAFRDEHGKFQWREMVKVIGERMHAT